MKKNLMSLTMAWIYEILAAITGIAVAIALTMPYYEEVSADGLSGNEMSILVAMAVPFFMAAVAELLKIPFVQAFMTTSQRGWKVFFGGMIFVVAVITFETMITGLSNGFSARNHTLTEIMIEIDSKESQIATLSGQSRVVDGNAESKRITDSYNVKINGLKDQKLNIISSKSSILKPMIARLENLESKLESDKKSFEDKRKDAQRIVDSSVTQLNKAIDALTACKVSDQCWITAPFEKAVDIAQKGYDRAVKSFDSLSFNSKYDSEIRDLKTKIASEEVNLSNLPSIAAINEKIMKANDKFEKDMENLRTTLNSASGVAESNQSKRAVLENEVTDLKTELSNQGSNNFAYRISETLGISLNSATTILAGSLAFIIATLGPALATGYFVNNGQWVSWKRVDKVKRKSKFRALARAIRMKKRKPIIKEVEVEKIVEKEVFVDREVEVIKEVPVEKTIVKHVPVYTNNEDLLELTKEFKMDEELKDEHK